MRICYLMTVKRVTQLNLISIDLSAAFDLVDHDVLVKRLDNYFGFSATVLDWFKSFLSDRSQCVILGSATIKKYSRITRCSTGIRFRGTALHFIRTSHV